LVNALQRFSKMVTGRGRPTLNPNSGLLDARQVEKIQLHDIPVHQQFGRAKKLLGQGSFIRITGIFG